jgi:hypothetical protein
VELLEGVTGRALMAMASGVLLQLVSAQVQARQEIGHYICRRIWGADRPQAAAAGSMAVLCGGRRATW